MKNRLIWIGGLYGVIGGQCRVARAVIPHLFRLGYEVLNVGKGTQILQDGEQLPCQCIQWNETDAEALHKIIDDFKPDVILWSHDVWLYYILPDLKRKYPGIKFVGWFTIDAHPIHKSWMPLFRACDHVCTPTQFGRDTILQRWPEKAPEVIRYGVDRELYRLPTSAPHS